MIVGVLEAELTVMGSLSLKDKRRVIKSIKDRLSNKYNVSVAEVDALDSRQRAVLGIAMVANESRFVESCLSKIVDQLRFVRDASLVDYRIELY
ncbi:MAG: DUF503 domain-containing protein [Phycisphaerae bacterium]|nr:DUF503 domain-containing protein [Phycisphaerae bacterium]